MSHGLFENEVADLPRVRARVSPLAWLPIPILLAAMAVLWVAKPPGAYGSDSLILALNLIFSTLASAVVVYLISRSFLARGVPGLLVLGCGVLTWGASGVVAKALNQRDANLDVTIHNVCVWLSSVFHFASAFLLLRPRRALDARRLCLGVAYASVLGLLALVAMAALHGYTPTFFVQGAGGTRVRQLVLASAIVMFLFAAGLLKGVGRRPLPAFLYWYTLAVALIAIGLFGILIESVYASLLSWAGLAAQYLGGVYMVIAALAAVRESGAWHISLEAALRASEERYAAFAAATFEGIAESDAGRIVDCNEQLAQLLGRTVRELRGMAIADLIAPEDRDRAMANIRGNRESLVEHALLRKDGTRVFVEARGRPVAPGAARRYTAIRDITERKRAEEALRRSEEQFRGLFENMRDGFAHCQIVYDDQGRAVDFIYLNVNSAFARLTGLENVVGRRVSEILPGIHETQPELLETYARVARTEQPERFEIDFKPLAMWLAVSVYSPQPGHFAAVFDNITERKRSEREREAAVEFLRLVNASVGVHALIETSVRFFRKQSGCEAVGIRLRDGDDYPYYETHGFPEDFVRMENSLCVPCANGDVERDSAGNPVMECMCGNVICGRFDPGKPFFTAQGSFWANDTTRLLATTTDADRQARTRNRCNGAGYESVALIALRVGEQRLGLLQLNDRRKNMFTVEGIALWERLAGYLAVALAQASAQEALRRSEEQLRVAATAAEIGMWSWTPGTSDVTVSANWRRLFGVSDTAPVTFETWRDALHPDDRDAAVSALNAASEQHREFNVEYRVVHADGTTRWIIDRGRAWHDGQGRSVGMAGVNVDITERKQAEFDQDLATETLRVFNRGSGDLHSLIGEVLRQIRQRTGFDAVGLRLRQGDDCPYYQQDGFSAEFLREENFLCAKGLNGSILRDDRGGAVLECTCGVVLSGRTDPSMPCFSEGGSFWTNHSPELLALAPDDDPRTNPRNRCIHAGYESVALLPVRAGEQIVGLLQLNDRRPGRFTPERIRFFEGLANNFGLALKRRQAEEALKAATFAAESASKAKDQFIAVLSHELRTPLTPALAAVSMMEADMRLPGETREDLAMVRRNIALEVRLIADLLDVSRVISGKLHLEKRPMDVMAAIREAAQIVSGDLDAKGQTLTIDTPRSACLTFGDSARLQQVFWNLLRNANKFTPHRGHIVIRASVVPVPSCPLAAQPCPVGMGDCPLPQASQGNGEPCGGNLIVEVSDNGSGIAPDMLPRLFNTFEQGKEARSFGGLGLGLSICKAIVDRHGGSITAYSDGPGKGATFTVKLPIAQCPLAAANAGSPAADDESPATGGDGQDASPGQPGGLRILLVEDHPDTARLMSRLLMADGHEVMIADSVATGLAAVGQAAGKLDLLISDLGLPDGSGLDLMRRLREQRRGIPAIALSGYGAPADIEESKAAGFAEHLVKPTNPELVEAAIQRVMAYRNLVAPGGGGKTPRVSADRPG